MKSFKGIFILSYIKQFYFLFLNFYPSLFLPLSFDLSSGMFDQVFKVNINSIRIFLFECDIYI